MTTPTASVVHRLPGRIRVRVASCRGDRDFFRKAVDAVQRSEGISAEATPETGGILITGSRVSPEALQEAWKGLMTVQEGTPRVPSPFQVTLPLERLDKGIRRLSGGDLDMVSALFILLLATGFYELLRGNFRSPPWYTAFWYAFGLFTKHLIDRMEASPSSQIR